MTRPLPFLSAAILIGGCGGNASTVTRALAPQRTYTGTFAKAGVTGVATATVGTSVVIYAGDTSMSLPLSDIVSQSPFYVSGGGVKFWASVQ